jgi:type II secretory pathway pseudopilin PulG
MRGFILVELLVVIVIIGIIGSVVTPPMINTIQQYLERGASSSLQLLAAAERVYQMSYGVFIPFTPGTVTNVATINTVLRTDIVADSWNYAIAGSDGSTFTVTATRAAGPFAGASPCVYTISDADAPGAAPTSGGPPCLN